MGRGSPDLLLKGFFEYCIANIRKNLWILFDIYGAAVNDPLTKVEHGTKEYQNAYSWFINNRIEVLLYLRNDRPATFPAITIAHNSSQEYTAESTLGDQGYISDVDPSEFGISINRVVGEFTPIAYDKERGIITMPSPLNTSQLAAGFHMVVENDTGKSYVITRIYDDTSFSIDPNIDINLKNIYIVTVDSTWAKYEERTRFMDSYEIGCHASSNPIEAIWLAQLVEYVMLKYKMLFLENRNMELSTFTSTNVSKNDHYYGDNVYSKFFNLSFRSEMSWIRQVDPKIAKTMGGLLIMCGPKSPEELSEYIKKQYWKMEADKTEPEPDKCGDDE